MDKREKIESMLSGGFSIPILPCSNCDKGAFLNELVINNYLIGYPYLCDKCHKPIDAFKSIKKFLSIDVPFVHDFVSGLFNCKTSTFIVDLHKNGITEISFNDHGVPKNSRIVRLNYTPQGAGIRAVELHSNNISFSNRRNKAYIYGIPTKIPNDYPKRDISDTIPLAVYVTYTNLPTSNHDEKNNITDEALATAYACFENDDFIGMILPATIAIEFSCKKLIRDVKKNLELEDEGVKDKDLLQNLIFKISEKLNVKLLNNDIITYMNRLWGQRDNLAHTGKIYEPYKRENAMPQIISAFLIYRYIKILRIQCSTHGFIGWIDMYR